jgi:hypothetical protein
MGVVLAITGILISAITFSINWLSDIKKTRIEFAIIGTALSAAWYFGVGFATSTSQIIVLSLLSGSHGSATMETRSPMNNTLAYSS